jgi:AAA+ ATPase superfamily predicted ATPase
MKFYNRETEIISLNQQAEQANTQARMTVITGRRRMGKTLLALHCAEKRSETFLYLFVSKKSEALLCEEYLEEIKAKIQIPFIGKINTFAEIFILLLELSKQQKLTVIIDEFQEFFNINPAVYSEIQKRWDLQKTQACHLNLILIGSVYSLMYKIFENSKEPLFGRADKIIRLKSFTIKTLSSILQDNQIDSDQTLFDYYLLTGGTPKYIDWFLSANSKNYDHMLDFILQAHSPFLHEGKHVLIEEFGKEYTLYFSILQLIATGYTGRGELESILQKDIGGYLERLMVDYAVIAKHNPIDAKENTKLQKYKIIDNFLTFWFRFIYKYFSTIENENFEYARKIIDRDYASYSGKILEKFFHDLFWSSKQYNRVGSYWERGNRNEIDLVAFNDLDKKCLIADIKLDKKKINLELLKQRATQLVLKYPDYEIEYVGLSKDNLADFLSE